MYALYKLTDETNPDCEKILISTIEISDENLVLMNSLCVPGFTLEELHDGYTRVILINLVV